MKVFDKVKKAVNETTVSLQDKVKKAVDETTVSLQDKVKKVNETTVSLQDKVKKAVNETTVSLQDKVKKVNETTVSLQGKVKKAVNETTVSLQDKVKRNELKPQIIKQAANIDYSKISSALKQLNKVHPIPKIVILNIDLLQNAADEYKQSDNPNKDNEFLNYIIKSVDAKFILASIEPIMRFIPFPFGNMLVMLLKLIVIYIKLLKKVKIKKLKKYNYGNI
jgi:hypothetical protein